MTRMNIGLYGYCKYCFILLLLVSQLPGLKAQEGMNKEVNVVRPYSPTIGDAFKTRFIPRLDDSVQVPTHFDYFIQAARINPLLRLKDLDATDYRPLPPDDLKPSQITLGFGNYWTPMGKLSLNTLRNQKMSLGVDASHQSSQGSVKMADERKIYAGYGDSRVRIYGQRFLPRSTFASDVYFSEDHHYLYGYSTDSLKNGTPVTPMIFRVTQKDSVPFQRFIILGTKLSLRSNQKSNNSWQYRIDGGYDFLMGRVNGGLEFLPDDRQTMEHEGKLDVALSKEFEKFSVGGEIGGDYINRTHQPDTLSYVVANFDPWIGFNWKFVKLLAGPKVAMDRNAEKFLFYPRMNVEINITNLLVPYFGLNGYYENNTYRSITRENPYIVDNTEIKPTNHRFIAYGGLRGRIAPAVAFNLSVSWEDVRDLFFYIPDVSSPLRNKFLAVYDNGSILKTGGEISLRQSDNLSFIMKGNYYQYTLDSLDAPWHKPGWDLNFTTRYAWKKKLVIKADLFLYGKYSVPEPDPLIGKVKELNGLVDVNLAAEYRITSWMSAFAQINNLLSDKYFIWQNYPMQRINLIAGMSWIF
ncbi:MAG: hypothetical protein D4R64_17615 [Porphyromonadaceae bacterium]|nr:MAG: hypothetical protein D4R64_17615 [Porphyromonadaceae bacterium]